MRSEIEHVRERRRAEAEIAFKRQQADEGRSMAPSDVVARVEGRAAVALDDVVCDKGDVMALMAERNTLKHRMAGMIAEGASLLAERDKALAEVERLKHLIFVWRQASYSGTPDEYQRAAVDLEEEAIRVSVVRAAEHRKHPSGDYCVWCRAQWPCEESEP
jgi:hypothetical protein